MGTGSSGFAEGVEQNPKQDALNARTLVNDDDECEMIRRVLESRELASPFLVVRKCVYHTAVISEPTRVVLHARTRL